MPGRNQHTACALFKTTKKPQLEPEWLFKNTDLERRLSFSADQGSDGLVPAGMPQF